MDQALLFDRKFQYNGYNADKYLETGLNGLQAPYKYTNTKFLRKKSDITLVDFEDLRINADVLTELIVYGYDIQNIELTGTKEKGSFTKIECDANEVCIVGKLTFGNFGLCIAVSACMWQAGVRITAGRTDLVIGKYLFFKYEDRELIYNRYRRSTYEF